MLQHTRKRLAPLAALAASAVFAAPAAAYVDEPETAVCKGSEQWCTATFSLAGGAANKRLTVKLPNRRLKLVQVIATPTEIDGAYLLGRGRYARGGAAYMTMLNAVASLDRRAKLRLRFATPNRARRCDTGRLDARLTVEINGRVQQRGAFNCRQARKVADAWTQRSGGRSMTINDVGYRCRIVARTPQNVACVGGGTVVRFAALDAKLGARVI